MSEFQGEKFIPDGHGGDYYSGAYVDWLEDRVELLAKSNASLRKQLEAFRRQAARDYSSQGDYVPYPEEDRDR